MPGKSLKKVVLGLRQQNYAHQSHDSLSIDISARKLKSLDAILAASVRRNDLDCQFPGGRHHVPEVERRVVDVVEILLSVVLVQVPDRSLQPLEAAEVTPGEHVDVGVRHLRRLALKWQVPETGPALAVGLQHVD